VTVLAPGSALSARQRAELERRAATALRRARTSGRAVLCALTVEADPELDPAAAAFASRRPGEPLFCLEQPDREGSAVAALGAACTLEAHGPGRFDAVASAWRELVAGSVAEAPAGPRGSGPIAAGGFSFAPAGGASPGWEGFSPASLCVPELALARAEGEVRLTLSALVAPDDTAEEVLARLGARVAELRGTALPMLDPAPAERARIVSLAPPEHYESAVARAVERIRAGELRKVVLARAVEVHTGTPHDPAAIHAVLREAFGACFVFCVARGDGAFLGASPELLVRREGQRASTVALAGSTRRSADPSVDDHLGERLLRSAKDREEQAIVVRSVRETLERHSVWVTAPPEPVLVRMANIQHLATPIRAQLARPVGAVDLAGALHPTPAVGGEPFAAAGPLIPALEGLDRGWYAGPVGWTDAAQDGEFCVGLRSALVRGPVARCYAGVGVVRGSDPAGELAETELKLQALLPVLAG